MELARIAHERRGELTRGLKVAWWNGHSHGRFSGSTWYADHMFHELRRNCAAYLNIDQPGCRGATLYRPFCTADVRDWVRGAVSRIGGQRTEPDHPRKMADQSLWGVGVPSFSFLPVLPPDHPDLQKDHPEGGFPEYWHHPADTLDKMDKALLAEHCRVYAAALHELCSLERLPLNPAATAAVVNEEIERLESLSGEAVDLGDLREAGARFARACEALDAKIEGIDAAAANRALLGMSHAVNPVLYTQAGRSITTRRAARSACPASSASRISWSAGPRATRAGSSTRASCARRTAWSQDSTPPARSRRGCRRVSRFASAPAG